MPFFSRVFKHKDGSHARAKREAERTNGHAVAPVKPRFATTWESNEVVPEEVEELIHACTLEVKSRAEALDTPFLLLPFRPESDPVSCRTFIRNFFKSNKEGSHDYRGRALTQELRLTEPAILCSIVKWCWSRMPNGVVSWNVYELFRIGELESNMARNAFDTFVPLSVESTSRRNIIYDFFDLLASIAAHGKVNGMGGRKLSRLAAWWAFEQADSGNGLESGYKSWSEAADASSHLFFAYMRSRAPEAVDGMTGISNLPRSLQALVAQTEYPPDVPMLMHSRTSKVLMQVDAVSPTPFALLRRTKHFAYRDEDVALQRFSTYPDPMQALTEECRRVLECIAITNQSVTARSRGGNLSSARLPSGLSNNRDESWSQFQDLGFAGLSGDVPGKPPNEGAFDSHRQSPQMGSLHSAARSRFGAARPTTPSWADFLTEGFTDDRRANLMPPDKSLPPIGASDSMYSLNADDDLEPGELASITSLDLDDTFWWVWMSSLANEETSGRKAAFGRCALIETKISGGKWLVIEEQVKGASPGPEAGAYIAEKKSRFGFSRRNRSTKRDKSAAKQPIQAHVEPYNRGITATPSRSNVSPDQQAMIMAAAAELSQKQQRPLGDTSNLPNIRRGRFDDDASTKTNSMMSLGLPKEAGAAVKWANSQNRDAIRRQYLGDGLAGKGMSRDALMSREPSIAEEKENWPPQTFSARGDKDLPPPPPPSDVKPTVVFPAPLPPVQPVSRNPEKQLAQATTVPLPQVTPHEETSLPLFASHPALVPLPQPTPYEGETLPTSQKPRYAPDTAAASPDCTPAGNAGRRDRKPVGEGAGETGIHPAFRKQAPTAIDVSPSPQNAAEIGAKSAWQAQGPSHDPARGRLHKNTQADPGNNVHALRKMFGKKRDDPKRRSTEISANNTSLQPPSESSLGRRISLLRKKQTTQPAQPAQPAERTAPVEEHPSDAMSSGGPDGHDTYGNTYPHHEDEILSRPTTTEQHEASREFSRFDQGPLLDAPVFLPRASEETSYPEAPTPGVPPADYLRVHVAQPREEESTYATPLEAEVHQGDYVSPIQESFDEQPPAGGDRWAQIRKNAADRAAQASEAHSLQSRGQGSVATERTDDGDESGEETIEDRVARIKARVAQLTGGIDRPAAQA